MGQISILTTEQIQILDLIAQNPTLTSQFYFTGGTALSEVYLHHRDSEDLDFFSYAQFDNQIITDFLSQLKETLPVKIKTDFFERVWRIRLTYPNNTVVKIDFSYYPYKQVGELGKYKQFKVDSLIDIGSNKLMSITQRHEVKDYVDLYFLLKEFTFWDLREGMRVKFGNDLEPVLIASDFLVVEDFTFLPKMHVPLTLDKLKQFFRAEAVKIAKTAVE